MRTIIKPPKKVTIATSPGNFLVVNVPQGGADTVALTRDTTLVVTDAAENRRSGLAHALKALDRGNSK